MSLNLRHWSFNITGEQGLTYSLLMTKTKLTLLYFNTELQGKTLKQILNVYKTKKQTLVLFEAACPAT